MKLKDCLMNKRVNITYRTFSGEEDILVGYCRWTGSKLESLDGDEYSVEDEITKCRWDGPEDLTVWYESEWI